jgi:hypothetical protein
MRGDFLPPTFLSLWALTIFLVVTTAVRVTLKLNQLSPHDDPPLQWCEGGVIV